MRLCNLFAVLAVLSATLLPAQKPAPEVLPFQNASLSTEERVNDLVSRMTLDEKVSQLINTAPAIPRLDVPAYDWWNEGLHGIARSGYATMFPQAIGMAATWDDVLLGQIGITTSIEARAKYNEAIRHDIHSIYFGLTIWSPNINIFRDPRWGRGQETYGEDPFLTSRLGVAFVKGLQGNDPNYFRAVATPKHFAVHSGPESDRHRFNVDPSPHDLWDTYLPAFRATITEGHADSLMCAYNAVDMQPACANKQLLDQVLRKDWGFKGFVTSDCGAVDDFFWTSAHRFSPDAEQASVAAIRAGTDTNCGRTYLSLGDAVHAGLLQESELDVPLKRLFTARMKLGLFDPAEKMPYAAVPYSEVDSPAHRQIALEAARKSMVLLQNEGDLLPMRNVKTIAVVGPNAASLTALEGNYNAIPKDPVLPVDAIAAEFKGTRVLYGQGSPYAESVSLPAPRTLFHPTATSTTEGLTGEYFANETFSGKPVATRLDKQIDFNWNAAKPLPVVPAEHFAVRWNGTIAAPAPGDYPFNVKLGDCYPCQDFEAYTVFLDGKQVASFKTAQEKEYRGRTDKSFTLSLADTKRHAFRIEYAHRSKLFGAGITLDWTPPPAILQTAAVDAAKQADIVLAFLGLSSELEGEEMPLKVQGFSGGDRTDIKLPAAQQQLLDALVATGKPVVAVLMNGSALAINTAQGQVRAILEAWYPGEEGGRAIAETLSGKNNPAGRLPVTFYAGVDQLPPFDDYSMANRTYRYFKGKPLFGFGYGLSYTHFSYSALKLSSAKLHAGETLTVEADIKNEGSRDGDEVAELYLQSPHTKLSPALALEGFKRVHLAAGETQHVSFALDPRQLSQVDAKGSRLVEAGRYSLSLGGCQPSQGKTEMAEFTIEGKQEVPH